VSGVQFGWSVVKRGAMWLHFVSQRHRSLQISTVSNVQVITIVSMSDSHTGEGCSSEHTCSTVGKLLRSEEACMGAGWCSILTRPRPRRPVGNCVAGPGLCFLPTAQAAHWTAGESWFYTGGDNHCVSAPYVETDRGSDRVWLTADLCQCRGWRMKGILFR
jgi:hypothetical protein